MMNDKLIYIKPIMNLIEVSDLEDVVTLSEGEKGALDTENYEDMFGTGV